MAINRIHVDLPIKHQDLKSRISVVKNKILVGAFLLASATVSTSAFAGISSVTGDGLLAGAVIADLSHGVSENADIQGFEEDINITLGADISVDYDISDAGNNLTGFSTNVGGGGGSGTLVAGTYNSYLLHFDPVGAGGITEATFTFSDSIVAIVASIDFLQATDVLFNSATTDFNSGDNGNGRRSESSDLFSFVGNTVTLRMFSTNSSNVDHLRIITSNMSTEVVNAPVTLSFLLLGFAGLLSRRLKS